MMRFRRWSHLSDRAKNALICLLLIMTTFLVYWQVFAFDFSGYDDVFMVVANPTVCAGLTLHGVWWALTTSFFEYWHPLTWLSHMLDCQLFGLHAGWHHIINLLFHSANAALVFMCFRRMTGALWRSALVAAFFALHPAHVESVAWIAERKDVLSTLFFLLTLWGYLRYVENTRSHSPGSKTWYCTSLVMFALALMSKPIVVTVPFVLLLIDYWPLRRFELSLPNLPLGTIASLVREKIPFFGLSSVGCLITYFGVKAGSNLLTTETISWSLRLANVPIAYVRYIGKMLWPVNLVVLYPMPSHWSSWQVFTSVVLLLAISAAVIALARSAPYLIVGWFMFLGVLVPTIGLVQVGFHSMADRYAYIPFIGLFAAVIWGVADLWSRVRLTSNALPVISSLLLITCGLLTWHQTAFWQNGLTLWTHGFAAAPETFISRFNLGVELQRVGKTEEAMEQYRQVLRLKPHHIDANLNLGIACIFSGRLAEATNYLTKVLQLKPDYPKAQANMALALRELGDYDTAMKHCAEAIRLAPSSEFGAYLDMARCLSDLNRSQEAIYFFERSILLKPNLAAGHYYFALELLKLDHFDRALEHLEDAARLAPKWPDPHSQLASALAAKGQMAGAIGQYRQALALQADSIADLNNLAWLLATCPEATLRNGAEAVRLAQAACERTSWKQTIFIGTLAAAYAEAGDFGKAVETSQKACDLASSSGETNLLDRNRELLRQFKNREPHREQSPALASKP